VVNWLDIELKSVMQSRLVAHGKAECGVLMSGESPWRDVARGWLRATGKVAELGCGACGGSGGSGGVAQPRPHRNIFSCKHRGMPGRSTAGPSFVAGANGDSASEESTIRDGLDWSMAAKDETDICSTAPLLLHCCRLR
jgi:hypothetical protein